MVRGVILVRCVWCDLWHAEFARLREWLKLPSVEIDLGGFSILGPNQCAHAQRIPPASPTLSCTYSGATLGRGIDGLSERISVRNGEIRGMGGAGVSLTSLGRAEHLTVTDNGASGIFAPLSILNDLVVARNFGPGISGVYSSVTNSVAAQNQVGIADAQIITRCTIQQNTMGGVIATSVSVSGSTIANNGGDGLSLGWGILTGNNIGGNLGCGAKFATGVGASGAIGDNDFINNNLGVTCTGGGNQKQITGNVIATSCNVVTCTTGGVQVGSFCPTNTLTCL